MVSPNQWTWLWVNSGSWWWTGRPGMLQSMMLQRVGHNWVTELNWTELNWRDIQSSRDKLGVRTSETRFQEDSLNHCRLLHQAPSFELKPVLFCEFHFTEQEKNPTGNSELVLPSLLKSRPVSSETKHISCVSRFIFTDVRSIPLNLFFNLSNSYWSYISST